MRMRPVLVAWKFPGNNPYTHGMWLVVMHCVLPLLGNANAMNMLIAITIPNFFKNVSITMMTSR